jgi:acid phosphatase type 7
MKIQSLFLTLIFLSAAHFSNATTAATGVATASGQTETMAKPGAETTTGVTVTTGAATLLTSTQYDPIALYLTWQQDPTTTITIDWHDTLRTRDHVLQYRILDTADSDWSEATPSEIPFPFSRRTIYRVEVTGLLPSTEYEFRFGADSRVYRFRTMPTHLQEPMRIAIGGDSMHRKEWLEQVARESMRFDLDFVIMGGDMAYENGLPPDRQPRESPLGNLMYDWFDGYKNTFVTENGRVIPMVVIPGNHEVNGGYYYREENRPNFPPYQQTDEIRALIAPYFYAAFAMPGQPGYNVLDFGNYMSLILLDTDHSNPVEGVQTEWLKERLSERAHIPHLFPVYHVPAWPSVRSMFDRTQTDIRTHWVPLFEQNGVELAFENHDHAYKRTHPIRNGEVAANGILYMGDGAWGVSVREPGSWQDYEPWYIAKAIAERHFILLTLQGTQRHMVAINENGEIIDEIPQVTGSRN